MQVRHVYWQTIRCIDRSLSRTVTNAADLDVLQMGANEALDGALKAQRAVELVCNVADRHLRGGPNRWWSLKMAGGVEMLSLTGQVMVLPTNMQNFDLILDTQSLKRSSGD